MVAETAPSPRLLARSLCCWLLCCGLWWLAPAGMAMDPWQVSVPVPDQSQATRRDAERQALQRVLERLTAEDDLLERSEIRDALRQPGDYFQRSGFARVRDPELAELHPDARWLLELQADREAVLSLLGAARVPAWTGRRPEVLVLMLREAPDGERELLAPDTTAMRNLRRTARELAVPLAVPMLDLEDTLNADIGALWARFQDATEPFARRYEPDGVLVVRLYQDALGRWRGDWTGEVAGREVEGGAELDSPEQAGDLVARALLQRLASRFALQVGTGEGEGEWLWMQVDGLADTMAYAGMMRYLDELSAVAEVRLVEVQGSSVLLQVQSADAIPRLLEVLRLEQRLAPAEQPQSTGGGQLWRAWWRAGQS